MTYQNSSPADFIALGPWIITAAAAVLVLLVLSFRRRHGLILVLTLCGLAAAFFSLAVAAGQIPRPVGALFQVDGFALFYSGLILLLAFAVALFAYGYLEGQQVRREEFYPLLLLGTLGAMVLSAGSHFASFFLGLETLSVSLYVLIAYLVARPGPVEAGLKYLILAGASSAFLLFGMALVYAASGTMLFSELSRAEPSPMFLAGLGMMLVAAGFKLALVPFHLWTPDVYQGAPAPAGAFIATVSKGAMIAVLLRVFFDEGAITAEPVWWALALPAFASMLCGNLLALLQENVKRILAYSSIAHFGYLMTAFLAARDLAVETATFYLVGYCAATLAAFGVVTVLSEREREAERFDDYRGLFWRRPALATVLTTALLSLAGIPLTVGFPGKFYLVAAGVDASLWVLLFALLLGSAIGLFYYLRVIVVMFGEPPVTVAGALPVWSGAAVLLAVLTLVMLWLGVDPEPLIQLIRRIRIGA